MATLEDALLRLEARVASLEARGCATEGKRACGPPLPPSEHPQTQLDPPCWKELKAMHDDVHILRKPEKRKSNLDITSLSDQVHPNSCCKRS